MRIRQQFTLHDVPDPFTLLKVSQAFREIACGEALEFNYEGMNMPEELFKVLPVKEYTVVEQDQYEAPVHCRIVIRKTAPTPAVPEDSSDGCRCG